MQLYLVSFPLLNHSTARKISFPPSLFLRVRGLLPASLLAARRGLTLHRIPRSGCLVRSCAFNCRRGEGEGRNKDRARTSPPPPTRTHSSISVLSRADLFITNVLQAARLDPVHQSWVSKNRNLGFPVKTSSKHATSSVFPSPSPASRRSSSRFALFLIRLFLPSLPNGHLLTSPSRSCRSRLPAPHARSFSSLVVSAPTLLQLLPSSLPF